MTAGIWRWELSAGSPPFVWAYGNSAGDLQMLRDAEHRRERRKARTVWKLRGFRSLSTSLRHGQPGTDAAPTTLPS